MHYANDFAGKKRLYNWDVRQQMHYFSIQFKEHYQPSCLFRGNPTSVSMCFPSVLAILLASHDVIEAGMTIFLLYVRLCRCMLLRD